MFKRSLPCSFGDQSSAFAEDADGYTFELDFPQPHPENIRLDLQSKILVVRSFRAKREPLDGRSGAWKRHGSCAKRGWEEAARVHLVDGMDTARIHADFSDGKLTLEVPRERTESHWCVSARLGTSHPLKARYGRTDRQGKRGGDEMREEEGSVRPVHERDSKDPLTDGKRLEESREKHWGIEAEVEEGSNGGHTRGGQRGAEQEDGVEAHEQLPSRKKKGQGR